MRHLKEFKANKFRLLKIKKKSKRDPFEIIILKSLLNGAHLLFFNEL